jgi:adenylosuccinate lyase
MIERYTLKRMGEIWSPENRFQKWLKIEILVCEALCKKGVIPKKALANIKKKAIFQIPRIEEIEKTTKHDVISFLTNLSENIGEDARYIHWGLTSSDILDTSLSLLLKEAAVIILEDIDALLMTLKKKAFEYKNTLMIGRTHGVHAEPITFGLKIALWYEEMKRNLQRMVSAKERISYGKISGAVGTFSYLPPDVEGYVCQRCGLKPAPISSQILQRDRHAEYFTTLAIIASSIEKFALEIRHLQRTEVLEAEEFFGKGQKGSSAMPHKRNPILSENICGVARLVRGNALAALENIPLWHERDISHSSVERVIAPDSTILLDFMLNRFNNLIGNLVVYPKNMERNLKLTGGIFYSQRLMLKLIEKGLSREASYRLVQKNAMEAMKKGKDFQEIVLKNKAIKNILKPREIEKCFSLKDHLHYLDTIFDRVFTL